jgi:hypothetical protein
MQYPFFVPIEMALPSRKDPELIFKQERNTREVLIEVGKKHIGISSFSMGEHGKMQGKGKE